MAGNDNLIEVNERWSQRKLRVEHGNGVILDDVLYASHRGGGFTAVDANDGTRLWSERIPKATVLAADGKLFVLDESGILHLVAADRTGFRSLGSVRVASEPAWTVPTIFDDALYVRDRTSVAAFRLPK